MKHLFIVNPAAGVRDCTAAVTEQVNAVFARRTDDYEIYTTRAPMDAADKIRREADQVGALRVYACGGDGTLNECVCGAAGLDNVALTHFPKGMGTTSSRSSATRHRASAIWTNWWTGKCASWM